MVDNQTKRTISNKTQLPDYDTTSRKPINKSFQPPDLEIDFSIDSRAESINIIVKPGMKFIHKTPNFLQDFK